VGLQGGSYAVIDNEGEVTEVLQPYARTPRSREPRRRGYKAPMPLSADPQMQIHGNSTGHSPYDDSGEDKREENTAVMEASFAPTEITSPIVRTKGAMAAVVTLDGWDTSFLPSFLPPCLTSGP